MFNKSFWPLSGFPFTQIMRTRALVLLAVFVLASVTHAQRKTDNLDRGLVGVKVTSGVYLSWRVQADEYYDVSYNLYRNGTLIAQNLKTSNYSDASGSTSSKYTVAAVRNGVTGAQCAEVTPWTQQYLQFPVADVQDRTGATVWKQSDPSTAGANYTINDISLGDVDGDGKVDFIVKRKNQTDQDELFPTDNLTKFCQIECYASSINYGRLWWIDCGPNICYGADEQWDAVAFDWNEDGACEVLYRGGANTVIHHKDGTTETIGNVNENIRGGISHVANMTFTNSGEEWLMYIDGRTGKTYDVISYPIARGKASDWGDGYGHRSSKYFMGAPYLDGVNPYIFLGRGIYTQTLACTYRVNKSTNKLYKVGNTWNSYTNKGWHGQGYHNFAIADVDEDGSDEIVYGSMVLDFHLSDTSLHGMSSTGLGHGDASHTGDFDPFRKGLETFACNEDNPGFNYRNAATCEIYARGTASGDDGRSMAGNFTNQYPGGLGASASSGLLPLSLVQSAPYSPEFINGWTNDWNANTPNPIALNFRIYWDGDLLDETVNGPGSSEGYLFIDKLGARIYDTGHGNYETSCINGTKKNPCAQGDILGDWREELVMRSSDNRYIRVYTTVTPTQHRLPSLWYDHQYRQSIVWQTEGYNQPPHTSFFVGELEGLTQAPPPLTTAGRTVMANNSTIGSSLNGKDVLIMPDGNGSEYKVTMAADAKPSTIYLNSRTTVEGGDQVAYKETKHTFDRIRLNGAALSGTTNVAKQGSSAAHLPNAAHTHTGKTDVWQGALLCGGSMENSPLWANRHTELFLGKALTTEAGIYKSLEMEYGSALYLTDPGISIPIPATNGYAHMTVGDLSVKEGSRIVFDIKGTGNANGDRLNITGEVSVRKQNWQYGPEYLAPVFEFRSESKLAAGDYLLGTFGELAVGSSLDNIIIECPNGVDAPETQIYEKEGNYYLHVGNERVNTSNAIAVSIVNGDFSNGGTGWEGAPDVDSELKNAEFFYKTFRLAQTLTGLEDGWYSVRVQGFYRNGLSGGKALKAMLFANDTKTYLRSLYSEQPADCGLSGYPDNMTEAGTAFSLNRYWNEIRVYVEGGSLTFGILKNDLTEKDWTMFDNFTVDYLGAVNKDKDRTQYIGDNSFESGSLLYWTSLNTVSGGDTKVAENSNSTYTVSNADGNYIYNTWAKTGTFGVSQVLKSLPAGVYRLTALLASDKDNRISLNVKEGLKKMEFKMENDKSTAQKIVCDNIIIENTSDVRINFTSGTWFKLDDVHLVLQSADVEKAVIDEIKGNIEDVIADAKDVMKAYPKGTGIFDYNTSSVDKVITEAENAVGSSSVTREQADSQLSAIKSLLTDLDNGNIAIDYNGPAANARYNIILSGKPVTLVDGSTFGFSNGNACYLQAFILEKDENSAYSYRLCFPDEEGNYHYLCLAGDNSTVTVTTDVSKAMSFRVERSADYSADGVFYLRNSALSNSYLNNIGGGLKTGSKGSFTISVADKAEVTLSVSGTAEWGTFIAPYAVDIPDGAKAYTVLSQLNGEFLALNELTGTIPANTPVLLSNSTGSGIDCVKAEYGTASRDDYQSGLLVGRYSTATLPVSDAVNKYYVLQRQDGETSFYQLTTAMDAKPNRCYLKVPAGSTSNSRLRLPLVSGDFTSINSVGADAHLVEAVYGVTGKLQNGIKSGINIVRFKDGSIRKFMIIK